MVIRSLPVYIDSNKITPSLLKNYILTHTSIFMNYLNVIFLKNSHSKMLSAKCRAIFLNYVSEQEFIYCIKVSWLIA